MDASTAATRMQARFRGIQGREQAPPQLLAPTTLAGKCAILRRELGLSGMTIAETVHTAATQLGVDDSGGQPLGDIAALCMKTLGMEQGHGVSTEDITLGGVEASARPAFGRMDSECGMAIAISPSTSNSAALRRAKASNSARRSSDEVAEPSLPLAQPVARATLAAGSPEYERIAAHFRDSLSPSERVRFDIVSIEKLHNTAFKDMYDVSLRHMGLREQNRKAAGKEALELERLELVWSFHGCSADVVDNIIANGLNRSYAGQHATVYGKGVYFARDASYSARETYSPKDAQGQKHVFLCRLALGSHVQVPRGYGTKITETEPPVRDANRLLGVGALKHDTTTGGDTRDGIPEVMVAYKDSQGYPEYLVTFTPDREAEEKARREAAEKARREAAEKARKEAEEEARRNAWRREAAEKARSEAEKAHDWRAAKAKREAEERAWRRASAGWGGASPPSSSPPPPKPPPMPTPTSSAEWKCSSCLGSVGCRDACGA
jgi:poly [ADP-ribose] polymerase 10/14/15